MTETPPRIPVKGVTPYLMVKGATEAAEFYRKAFGAEIAYAHPVDETGRTYHIHLYVNGISVMLSDVYPEHCGGRDGAPQGFNLMMRVDDVDAWWARAVAAGAEVVMPLDNMFWGDRYGQVKDPFGVHWALSQPLS